MNQTWKPSKLLACLFAFIAFVGSFVTLALMLIIGTALPGYARGEFDAGEHIQDVELLLVSISVAVALAFAVFIYRFARHTVSREFVFHTCFFSGLMLLGYCLWASLTLIPIIDHRILSDWSAHIVQVVFSGPVVCLLVIPAALLLLIFAMFHNNPAQANKTSFLTPDLPRVPPIVTIPPSTHSSSSASGQA